MSNLQPPSGFQRDAVPPYRIRIFKPEYAALNPLEIPWIELRRAPQSFPKYHVAKRSSERTVVGMDFVDAGAVDRRIYIKRSFTTSRWRRLWRPFRPTKEWNELLLAAQFSALGVVVPEPIYYAEADWDDARYSGPVTFFASLALPGHFHSSNAHFTALRSFGPEWLALAALTRELHDRSILHADYRADHIYVSQRTDGAWDWALLDLDGSRVGAPVDRAARQRALRQLTESLLKAGLGEEDLKAFVDVYDPAGVWRMAAPDIYAYALRRER